MNTLRVWDKINDFIGTTPFHPQYFVIKAEKSGVNIALNKVKGKVLDVGCGRQLLKAPIENLGLSYTSLDHPRIYKRQRGIKPPDILADITDLPIPKNSFDSVLLFMVMAHLPRPFVGVKEIYRILKKNGLLFMSGIENYPAHDLPDDYFRCRIAGLEAICLEAGFTIKKSYFWGNVWQVNSINFNMFLLQTAKYIWDKKRNLLLLIVMLTITYPFIFVSNIIGILLGPTDFLKNSKLINFVIAQK